MSPLDFKITRVNCSFSIDHSKVVPLLQFFIRASVVQYVAFVLSSLLLSVPQEVAALHGTPWIYVSSRIFYQVRTFRNTI